MKTAACVGCLILVAFASQATAQTPAAEDRQTELEEKFAKQLSGAVLAGNYTVTGEKNAGAKEEKYTLTKVSKLNGDLWLFQTRIQYGSHDVTVPLPLRVKWAGDTPVITVDRVNVPGLGVFNSRVLIFDGHYAGTWAGQDHGGHLFGRILPPEAADKDKSDEGKK